VAQIAGRPRKEIAMAGNLNNVTGKMLGDAGEHYALSQFTFAGKPASKMPDGWPGYDLAVDTGEGLARVSVRTRSETPRWQAGSWFTFDQRVECDWLVFLFKPNSGPVRSWVIPFRVACEHGNRFTARRKDPQNREVSWAKLKGEPFARYENNWELNP
jgi:hypothetical protein